MGGIGLILSDVTIKVSFKQKMTSYQTIHIFDVSLGVF